MRSHSSDTLWDTKKLFFFIFIVEKMKNSDDLPSDGYQNEIRKERIAHRTNPAY